MLNTITNWDKVTKHGNPTHCCELNGLIGLMIKMEVARRGMPLQARWDLMDNKYHHIIGKLGVGDIFLGT